MTILVGDVGGTKTVLALVRWVEGVPGLDRVMRLPSGAYPSMENLVQDYLNTCGARPTHAAFAVAGPVQEGRSQITNLPWLIESEGLKRTFALQRVTLLNDLEAIAWGIAALADEDVAVLHGGDGVGKGNACVIAAGTGLGQAGLFWDGQRHHPFATEGGHADFAARTDQEVALLEWLRQGFGHVSWERLVSGPGIGNIYAFLRRQRALDAQEGASKDGDAAGSLADMEEGEDAAARIAQGASRGDCPLCTQTMELFVSLYGREAGNLALKHMALGGVYLGGGIAPKNLELFRGPAFMQAFLDKGRMAPLMELMPVKVILNPDTPLLGAARYLNTQVS